MIIIIKVKLKQLLEQKNITMYWLAKETGISHAGIINMANEKTEGIKYTNLDKICEALDCNVEEVIEHVPNETEKSYGK